MNDWHGGVSLQKYRDRIDGTADRKLDIEPLPFLYIVIVPSFDDSARPIQDYSGDDAHFAVQRSLERVFDDACRRYVMQMSDASLQFLVL